MIGTISTRERTTRRSRPSRFLTGAMSVAAITATLVGLGVTAANASEPDPGAAPATSVAAYTSIATSPGSVGYWAQPDANALYGISGDTIAGGGAATLGPFTSLSGAVSIAASRSGKGLIGISPDGEIQTTGDFLPQVNGNNLHQLTQAWDSSENDGTDSNPITGVAVDATGQGFWALDSQGNVYNIGDAPNYGEPSKHIGAANSVDIKATPSGDGYIVLADDGGVFTYGDAGFYGHPKLNSGLATGDPATGIAFTPDGKGYWISQFYGAVTAWGDAPADTARTAGNPTFGESTLNIATNFGGGGYFLVAEDGTVTTVATAPTCFNQTDNDVYPGESINIDMFCQYDPENWTIVKQPRGTLTEFNAADGGAVYTAPDSEANYQPIDTFTFESTDGNGHVSNIATVTVNIMNPDSE